ncbi:hypothetical protein ACJ72_08260 [Emergomyces africanus]|uniref:Myb-like domain-containing protein n=1 Tax=Emergomyces africanus TaxID=1955775 RepID=A0A1B7NKT0_9EURO|nr:hypothetical protein ACJ72_08260 [Emergomyces africanus]
MPGFSPINKSENDETLSFEDTPDAKINGDEIKDIKEEDTEDAENGNDVNGDGEKGNPNGKKTTATPRKRGRKPISGKANGEEDANEDESPTKKQRTPAKGAKGGASGDKGKAGARPMPTSYENATPEDKMLLRMKDDENKSWAEIRQAWEEMTGEKVGGSTLCGRYGRMKANFVVFTPEDEARLLRFKKEIEDKFENEKWHSVSKAIGSAGGNTYPPAAVQKRFKELNRNMSKMVIKQEQHEQNGQNDEDSS